MRAHLLRRPRLRPEPHLVQRAAEGASVGGIVAEDERVVAAAALVLGSLAVGTRERVGRAVHREFHAVAAAARRLAQRHVAPHAALQAQVELHGVRADLEDKCGVEVGVLGVAQAQSEEARVEGDHLSVRLVVVGPVPDEPGLETELHAVGDGRAVQGRAQGGSVHAGEDGGEAHGPAVEARADDERRGGGGEAPVEAVAHQHQAPLLLRLVRLAHAVRGGRRVARALVKAPGGKEVVRAVVVVPVRAQRVEHEGFELRRLALGVPHSQLVDGPGEGRVRLEHGTAHLQALRVLGQAAAARLGVLGALHAIDVHGHARPVEGEGHVGPAVGPQPARVQRVLGPRLLAARVAAAR
mmetsp:Transcript_4923/g.14513  ORF Transcript_4923/g.14513 Transcript_4923/m.14513 type:complete len:354 (-) Transcript_4923:1705-2766(-)